MEVSNNNLLNILLPNDNKVIREALKQADMNQLASSSKNASVQHILTNLFNDITSGTKSNETILNLLKNSNVFNELSNFPKELQSLSSLVKNDPSLTAFQSKLDNFMVNISTIDETNLKAQINNSGIFLESKIGSALGNLSNTLQNTLLELKQSLLNTPNLDSKSAIKLIDSILSNANSSNPNKIMGDMKELLGNLKTIVAQLNTPQQNNPVVQAVQKLETLFNKELVNNPSLMPTASAIKPEVANELKSVFTQLQSYFNVTNTQASKELTTLLDKLVQPQNLAQNPNIVNESKDILNQLKQLPQIQAAVAYNTQTTQVSALTAQLESIVNSLSQQSSSAPAQVAVNNQPLDTQLGTQLKTILTDLHKAISNMNLTPTSTAPLLQQIQSTLLPQNFTQTQTLVNNIQQLLTQLYSSEPFGNSLTNNAQNKEVVNLINRFEAIVTKEILNNPAFTNPQQMLNMLKEEVSHDMKGVLLQLQKELATAPQTQNTQEMLKNIDKLLVQIDYNQLMSLTTNSNTLYLPFLWDLLEEGTIATAKGENEKFYCQINLKLKEHGKLDLLVALYSNNIEITVHAQRKEFKQTLQENIQELKQSLNSVGLISSGIKFYDLKEDNPQEVKKEDLFFGNQIGDELNFGINIRV